ncbi:MAG: substrate-binding domain-containing protein [Planctomycetota bacterium]|nr:substrate-binding domain-containing protein [Planctomycetota bacterium]
MSLNREPLHQQIARELRNEVRACLKPGERLESEARLARRFEASIVTVREALLLLVQEGRLVRRQGSGTYVAERPPEAAPRKVAILAEPDLSSAHVSFFFPAAASALQRLLESAGYAAEVFSGRLLGELGDDGLARRFEAQAEAGELAGVAAVAALPREAWVRVLARHGLPLVGPASRHEYGVRHDEEAFLAGAVEYLVARGRRRIAAIGWYGREGDPAASEACLARLRARFGVELPAAWIPPSASHEMVGAHWNAFHSAWRARDERPDGLVIADDLMAREVLPAVLTLGLRVPEDLLVLCHANRGSGLRFPVPVVELRYDPDEYGRAMGEMLLQRIRGEAVEPKHRLLSHELLEPAPVLSPPSQGGAGGRAFTNRHLKGERPMTPSFAAAVRAALLLACAWTFAASAAEDAAEAEFFLPPGAFEGFRKDGEALVPLAQVHALDAGGVLFEAERPDEVLWAPGGQAGEDSDGTRYAAGFKMLRYYVQSAKPAKVALWARLKYAPENVRLHVNEGQWTNASDLTAAGKDPKAKDAYKEFAGAWRWSKLAVFEVPAGVSPLQLVAPWPGYNHSPLLPWPQDLLLDKLALLAGDANPEQAPPAERRAAPAACWVRSQALNLEAARGFGTPALKGSGAAVLETSADDGKTWSPAGAAAPGGRLLVRARFEPGAAARVEGFAVRARVDAAKYLRLRSPVLELGFDIAGHGVHRLTDLAAGRALLHPETARPLFTLELKERGKPFPDPRHILEPKDGVLKEAKLKDGGRAAELTYLFLDGALRATASLDLGKDREILWKLELKNDSAYDILSYVFPRLGGIQVGGSGRDDTFLNTNFYGPWLAVTETFGEFRPEDRPFPGWGRLAFCDLSDAKAGLALATREPREGETSYVARPTLPRWGETISLDAVKNHCVPAGEKKSWTYALYAHEGGWQAAADWHGAWFRKEFGAAEFPEWARDSHGWLNENTALKDAYFKWPMLWDAFENARRLGLNHVQVWGQFGCNSCAAFWWPSPKFGTAEEFAAQNRRIKAAGGHIGYYLMYHIYNRYNNLDTETYEGYLPRGDYPSGVPLLTVEQLKRGAMVGDPSGKAAGVWPENDKELDEFRANLKRLLDAKESTTWANSKDGTFPKHSMVTLNPWTTSGSASSRSGPWTFTSGSGPATRPTRT